MKPVAGWSSQIVYPDGKVDILKLAGRAFGYIRWKPLGLTCDIELLRTPIRERLDHILNVSCNVTLVNILFPTVLIDVWIM